MPEEQPIDETELEAILTPFRPLVCWRVGLAYGSLVYFRMGERIESHLLDGRPIQIGSAEFTLWGDHWTILEEDRQIANSQTITRDFTETVLSRHFVGREFLSVACDRASFRFTVAFSGNLEVSGSYQDEKDEQQDLATLFLPDGTIIALSKANGLYVSGEVDERRAEHWRSTHPE